MSDRVFASTYYDRVVGYLTRRPTVVRIRGFNGSGVWIVNCDPCRFYLARDSHAEAFAAALAHARTHGGGR